MRIISKLPEFLSVFDENIMIFSVEFFSFFHTASNLHKSFMKSAEYKAAKAE